MSTLIIVDFMDNRSSGSLLWAKVDDDEGQCLIPHLSCVSSFLPRSDALMPTLQRAQGGPWLVLLLQGFIPS